MSQHVGNDTRLKSCKVVEFIFGVWEFVNKCKDYGGWFWW